MDYVSSMRDVLPALDEIYALIAESVPAAQAALQKLKNTHRPFKNKAAAARADLLELIIAATCNTFDKANIDDKKMLRFFEKQKQHDNAALLLLAKTKHYLNRGNIAEGEKCLTYIKQHLLPLSTLNTEVSYLHYTTQIYATKGEHAQRMFTAEQAFEKLAQIKESNSWWYGMFAMLSATIADVYQRNRQHDEAWPYLAQALKVCEEQNISAQHRFHIYRHIGLHYNFKEETEESISWYEKALAELTNEDNLPYLIVTNSNLAYQYYWLYQETPATQKAKRARQMARMDQLLVAIAKYNARLKSPVHRANLLITRSRVEYLKQNYATAIQLLDKALPVYQKQKQDRSVVEYYQLVHKAWHAWGLQAKDYTKLATAYKYLQHYTEIVKADAKKTTAEKLNAVKNTYELQQKKLTEQLMKQQIDALNNEMQLTTLSLHDKILVLDELKDHVKILGRKGLQIGEMSKSILQKIDAVKITDHDKKRLQQKLAETSKHLAKNLNQKFPILTPLEINMCGLFKTGITDKELAMLYGQSYKSYGQHRWRIKKKMKLGRQVNLIKYLQSLDM
ncbi:MAG TPA: tetratricopeptide repeat protein [Chitinophagales bacterium]|nr:tetratricopeptide repeat protein [Chitinophagales bacterium]